MVQIGSLSSILQDEGCPYIAHAMNLTYNLNDGMFCFSPPHITRFSKPALSSRFLETIQQIVYVEAIEIICFCKSGLQSSGSVLKYLRVRVHIYS